MHPVYPFPGESEDASGKIEPDISINIPMVSAIMQSVSDDRMAVALAQEGGISFIYGSQAIEKQAEMIHKVKRYRAGFVVSDSNVSPDMTLADVLAITEETGHSTIAVTADGQPNGKLLGIVTNKDYRVSRMGPDTKVKDFMTTLDNLVYADESTTLKEANDIIWEHKINCLPLVNKNQELVYLVFRKDYDTHKKNENELIDSSKRYMVGAGINTRDYEQRVPALLDAGADVLSIITPSFAAASQQELYDHYRAVAEAVDIPIVLYNIPARTGNALAPETVARLSRIENIVGAKDSSGNWDNMKAYLDGTRGSGFAVLSGNDALILKTLQNGGKGGITAVANILPEMMVSIYQNWKKGDMAAAEAAQQGIQPIRDCFKYGNPNSIVKRAANLIGQPLGPCRKPFGMVSEETDNAILDTIDRYYAAYKR